MLADLSQNDMPYLLSEDGAVLDGPSSAPDDQEYQYFRIFELEQEIRFLYSIFYKRREMDCILAPEREMLWENDWLKIQVRKWKDQIYNLEVQFKILMQAHKDIVNVQMKLHLDNEDKIEDYDMRELLRNTKMDVYESKCLLHEIKKVAWELLPEPIGKYCSSLDNRMGSLKLIFEELQLNYHNTSMTLERKKRELIVLNLEILKVKENKKLLEIIFKQHSLVKRNWNKRLIKMTKRVLNGQAILTSYGLTIEDTRLGKVVNTSKEESSEDERSMEFISNKIKILMDISTKLENDIEIINKEIDEYKKNNNINEEYNAKLSNITNEINALLEKKNQISLNLKYEIVLRKTYYNEIEDLKGKIRVFCRCRPISKDETKDGRLVCVTFPDIYTISVTAAKKERKTKEFQFDKVYIMESSQAEIFADTSKIIQSAFDGYNVCIFAYGQTGSGKTYTLIGNLESNPGIVPRTFDTILEIVNTGRMKFKVELKCYMLELYNEKLLDLLTVGAEYTDSLEIKKDVNGMVTVQGANIVSAISIDELKELFRKGNTNRHIASTKMNSESSRSHLIFGIIVICRNIYSEKKTYGKLSIIDLAGSERLAKSGSKGVGAQEAMSINMSLSALGDVISALTSGLQFIPYRNNKLTMLMQDSLGGNSKTLMFVNISPVDYNNVETITSLTYAARVKLIKNDALKVPEVDQIEKLQKVIERLLKGEQIII